MFSKPKIPKAPQKPVIAPQQAVADREAEQTAAKAKTAEELAGETARRVLAAGQLFDRKSSLTNEENPTGSLF